MTIQKESFIDQLQISHLGDVSVRTLNRIVEGGKVIAQDYHRTSFEYSDDLSSLPKAQQEIISFAWSKVDPELVEERNKAREAAREAMLKPEGE